MKANNPVVELTDEIALEIFLGNLDLNGEPIAESDAELTDAALLEIPSSEIPF